MKRAWVTYHSVNSQKKILLQYVVKFSKFLGRCGSVVFMLYERPRFCSRGEGVLPYKRLMGKCRWMGSNFHDWIDYNGVAFLIEFLEWVTHFRIFGVRKIFIFAVSKRT